MAVVINEFEVVAEPPRETGNNGSGPVAEPSPPSALEACAVAAALQTLERKALRVWAH